MIPCLLQHRVSVGSTTSGVVNPPDWSGQIYESVDYQLNTPASAASSFIVRADGSWSATSTSGTVSGSWIVPSAAGIGSGYKIRYVVTAQVGTGASITEVNGATSIASLSVDRSFTLAATRSTNGTTLASRTVRVDIYNAADVLMASGSFTLLSSAEVGS